MHSTALILFLSIVGFSLGQQGDRKWGEFLQPRPIAQVTANPGSENAFPAWYHMPPKQQHSPAYGYDRQPQTNQQVDQSYRGYPSFNRQPPAPSSSPYESPSAPRRPFPQPDDETAVQKYHKLLLRKPATTPRTNHRRTIDNTVPPHLRPVHGTRPTQGLPRPGEATDHPRIVLSKMKTVRPIVNRIRERLRLKKILPDGGVTPAPETPGPETTTEILEFEISATTPPSYPITKDSSPWHKLSWTRKATVESTTEIPTTANSTVTKGRFICNKTLSSAEKRENEKRPRIGPFKAKATWMTHPATTISTTTPSASREVTRPHTRWTLYDILSWPNAELLNAIRDVVSKFKASLDESGLDQDVRQMGRQLQNTWQQLRAGNRPGLDRSWNALRLSAEQSLHSPALPYGQGPTSVNEQLTQMFARSQSQDAPRK